MNDVFFTRQGGAFIDPVACGSSIQWRVYVEGLAPNPNAKADRLKSGWFNVSGEISLSDCSRVISWDIGEHSNALDKVDAAIAQLQMARRAIVAAEKVCARKQRQYGMEDGE